MVDIVVQASDPTDIYSRKWVMWLDYQPKTSWWLQQNIIAEDAANALLAVEDYTSGRTLHTTADIPDGNHELYFGISQDGGPAFGTYSGSISFDGIQKTFSGFDANVIGKWDITVKNGKIVSIAGVKGNPGPGGITGLRTTLSNLYHTVLSEGKNAMTHEWVMHNWPYVALAVAVPVVGGGAYVILKHDKRRM